MKKLTVIIPAYNAQDYIIRTLSSLVKQNLSEVEIMIVNDGSSDETKQVVQNYFDNKKNIDYKVIDKVNGGVGSARNVGIRNASGKYILFLDSDDYVADDFIDIIMTKIDKKFDVVSWKYNKVKEDGTLLESYQSRYAVEEFQTDGISSLRKIIVDKNYAIWTGSAIYRRQFIIKNNLSFEENCLAGEDLEFIYKSLLNANWVYHLDKTLSYYVFRQGSITNSFNVKKYDAVYAMQRVHDYILKKRFKNSGDIAKKIYEEESIMHYLYTTLTYFMYVDNPSNKNLYKYMDENYPGLRDEMNIRMKNYKGTNHKQTLKIKLFRSSPKLYFMAINLKSKIKLLKTKEY